MWKYNLIGKSLSDREDLNEEYAGCYFTEGNGMLIVTPIIEHVATSDCDFIELNDKTGFYRKKDSKVQDLLIKSDIDKKRINVKTESGLDLEIVPFVDRDFVFCASLKYSLAKHNEYLWNAYRTAGESIENMMANGIQLYNDDPVVQVYVTLALRNSYRCTNHLISLLDLKMSDVTNIITAALGYSEKKSQ